MVLWKWFYCRGLLLPLISSAEIKTETPNLFNSPRQISFPMVRNFIKYNFWLNQFAWPFWNWHHSLKYSTLSSVLPLVHSSLSCLLHLFTWVLMFFQTDLMGIQIFWQTGSGNQVEVIRAGRNSKFQLGGCVWDWFRWSFFGWYFFEMCFYAQCILVTACFWEVKLH